MSARIADEQQARRDRRAAETAASQRSRLIDAFTLLVATEGFAGTKIGEICSLAGVSNSAFYRHFDTKDDCFAAAYEDMHLRITESLVAADAEVPWIDFVRSALGGYLSALDADRNRALMFLVESAGGPDTVRAARQAADDEFVEILAFSHAVIQLQEHDAEPLDRDQLRAVFHGIIGMLHDHLVNEPERPLTELLEPLVTFVASVVLGAIEVEKRTATTE